MTTRKTMTTAKMLVGESTVTLPFSGNVAVYAPKNEAIILSPNAGWILTDGQAAWWKRAFNYDGHVEVWNGHEWVSVKTRDIEFRKVKGFVDNE